MWAIKLVNNDNYEEGDDEEKFVLSKHNLDKFETRSKFVINNVTNFVKNKHNQRIILWNYIDQMITFAVTLDRTENNRKSSHFDQLMDVVSAMFI